MLGFVRVFQGSDSAQTQYTPHKSFRRDYISRCKYVCKNITYAHVKDPAVHVSVRWIMETLQIHMRHRLGVLSQLAFLREGDPNFPWEKSQWDNTVVKKSVECVDQHG